MDDNSNVNTGILTKNVIGFSQFYGTINEVLAKYTHCALCGANLHFTYVTDFSRNVAQETARCPECGVRNRQTLHQLQ